ncbi:hypothetical protein R9X47_26955 [Wukongibacter baidiensis]|uniref:hypothetical protein n=1 Tax=Wukongibacter baidiensis TaxID=1723361 RepID=UPI003D800110
MKNFSVKSFVCGLTIGAIGITTVFASGGIKSAKYEDVKVYFNRSIIPLKDPIVAVVKDGEDKAKMYMPLEEILKYLGYKVEPNSLDGSINILTESFGTTNNVSPVIEQIPNRTNSDTTRNETDKKALEIMQKTGNWSYVEDLFPSMTSGGVEEVVDLYIKKTGNYKQAEAALPYINKDGSTKNGSNKPKTQSDYDALASEKMAKTGDIYSIMVYLPHMSKGKIDTVVKSYIDKTNKFNCIYSIRQYMSTEGIDKTVRSYVDRTGDYGTVAAILQFMSADASDYVARKYINEAKNQEYKQFFKPYLKKD